MDLDSFLGLADLDGKAGELGREKCQLYLTIINKCLKRVPALRPSSEDVRYSYNLFLVLHSHISSH